MLHSTASGFQIRVAAKCVSNNIAFPQYVVNLKVELATKNPMYEPSTMIMMAVTKAIATKHGQTLQ